MAVISGQLGSAPLWWFGLLRWRARNRGGAAVPSAWRCSTFIVCTWPSTGPWTRTCRPARWAFGEWCP